MIDRSEAEEHLRVIRSLMEKATIYRAISAPTALVGGVLSLAAAGGIALREKQAEVAPALFLGVWFAVLLVTVALNFWFMARDARRRGEVFVSSGMRLAIRSALPPFLCGALATVLNWDHAQSLAQNWALFYGLGLLATMSFAPRSISLLGWAFVAAVWIEWYFGWAIPWPSPCESMSLGGCFMAATFGLFHLIYAACTWPRRAR